MWLNDLFWGIRNTFVGKYHFLVINDDPPIAIMAYTRWLSLFVFYPVRREDWEANSFQYILNLKCILLKNLCTFVLSYSDLRIRFKLNDLLRKSWNASSSFTKRKNIKFLHPRNFWRNGEICESKIASREFIEVKQNFAFAWENA